MSGTNHTSPGVQIALAALALILLLSLALGALVVNHLRANSPAEQAWERAKLSAWQRQQEAERPARVFWAWAWRVLAVLAGLGALLVGTLYGLRYVLTIQPNHHGLYPLLMQRLGGAWVIYDPNRALTATVVGTATQAPERVHISYPLPPGLEEAQTRVTAQAQRVQGLAALHPRPQRTGLDPHRARALLSGIMDNGELLTRGMPSVKRSRYTPGQVQGLLGAGEGHEKIKSPAQALSTE
jgi:hypothetical protein